MPSIADYHDIEYRPGDVLHWFSYSAAGVGIALRTCSPKQWWKGQLPSHSSLVSRRQGLIKNVESTTLCPLPCEVAGKRVSGVQVHNPIKEIDAYNGRVWISRLKQPLREWQVKQLEEIIEGYIGVPYDMPGALLVGTRWLKDWFDPDDSMLFCDEAVIMWLCRLGVLDRTFNPSTKSPAWLARYLVMVDLYKPLKRIK